MKKIRIFATALLLAFTLSSCESFFDVELDDQAKIEDIFRQKTEVQKYLSHLYSYIPQEEEVVGMHGWTVGRADESLFSWYQWVYYTQFRTGNYSSATTNFNYWPDYYIGINQCSIFLKYIDLDKEDTPATLAYMKAEARFLRAYYYFLLFRQYGPVFIWGDQIADETIDGKTVDRHTVQQNIDFMVGELDAIKNDLPVRTDDIGIDGKQWAGRVTRGAALALKSRILLYAASPLYNGCDLYKGQMQNIRGEFLFPQSKDETKWEAAAQAAWDVIELAETGLYDLYKDTEQTDEFTRYMSSYQGVRLKPWNKETIWGWWWRTSNKYSFDTTGYDYMGGVGGTMVPALPPNFGFYAGFGGTAPSLKLADSYPMWSTGRYPVKGYEGRNDMSKPIVDPLSGYKTDGFTEGYKQYVDPLYPEWRPAIKAHNTCIDRDPRFYATMVPNGFYWPHQGKNKLFTCFNSTSATSPWSASSNCIRVGYAFRRAYPAGLWFDTSTEYTPVTSLKWVYPAFRMAEIYLNYAEACNEKPERDAASAIEYLNKVRNRAGLNNIEEAYPGIENDKELLRWCIHKERGVEFAFEAHRHYDACRWMEAKEEYPGPWYSLHCSATTYEESYQRVTGEIAIEDNVFRDKDYLCPIYSGTLAEMVNMTQNLGH